MSGRPTVAELNKSLKELVKWREFAIYLPGIEYSQTEIIKEDKRDDVVEQKMALYDKWLKTYSDALWDHVVNALEKADENTIAKQVKEKYVLVNNKQATNTLSTPSSSSECAVPPPTTADCHGAVKVSEDVVSELDESHRSFVCLVNKVQGEIEREVEERKLTTKRITRHLREERAYLIPSLELVQTTDDLFDAIHPHYNFLNCYLIVSIALHLLSDIVAQKATEYETGIKEYMKSVKIRDLKNILKRYHEPQRDWSGTRKVEIKVENVWGDQPLWLVEMLVKTLFPVKHPDELPWYDISHGSVIMVFIALEHMTPSLIESSRKKTEFMRLIGVISLKIGDELVWQLREDGDAVLSFEDSLIRATLIDKIEAISFLLQYAQVDINATNTNSTLIAYDDKVFRETGAKYHFRSYNTTFEKLLKNVKYELHELLEAGTAGISDDTIASINPPAKSNFINITAIRNVSHLLPEAVKMRIKKYNGSLENVKKRGMITDLETHLEEYFPEPFPGSVEVVLSLHSVWSTCSVWNVEQLGQLIFTPTLFYQLQWFRVDRREESVRVCLLADGKIINSLKECVSDNESRTSMLGVVNVQIDDTVMIVNDYSDGYTFDDAVELAKVIGDDELSDLLHQIWQSPREYKEVSDVDENKNFFFSPDPDSTPLMIACCNDNSRLVKLLLDHNADPNARNRRDNSALIYSTGNNKIFKMLLDKGADVFRANFFNYTTLHFASWVGNLKVVEMILDIDKEGKLVGTVSSNYRRPLDVACENRHFEIVQRLLQAKADPNIQDQDGNTPLLSASFGGHIEIVEALLQAKANPELKDNEGSTPLYGASCNGHVEIVEKLLSANANPNVQDKEGWTPLYGASRYGNMDIVEKLLLANADTSIPDSEGRTPLNDASRYGHTEIVELFLQANAGPNIQDNEGKTPLISATEYYRTDIVEKLLKANADADIQSNNGQTALMVACANSYIEIAELLLEAGANPDLKNNKDQTALDLAMETGNSHFIERLCNALYD